MNKWHDFAKLGALMGFAMLAGYGLPHPQHAPVIKVVTSEPVPPALDTPHAPSKTSLGRAILYRATLDKVARDYGIAGRLDCRVVQR